MVHKRQNGIAIEQQTLAGAAVGDVGELVGRDVQLLGEDLPVAVGLIEHMRELDEKKLLNGDVIDGIMMEDKKEVDKVILTGAELSKYFGKETTPREMKDQIIKLLDDWKGQQKEHEKPEKKNEQEK